MTIRRGAPWGESGALAPEAPTVSSDVEGAILVEEALASGRQLPELGLLGGDLHRTLGAPAHDAADLREGRGTRFPVDLGEVSMHRSDGSVGTHVFLAHLVVGRAHLWAGRTLVVMNASFRGSANLGPRAHPNDGLLDVCEGALTWPQRRLAARRAATGTHLPHPCIQERRTSSYTFSSDAPVSVTADGRPLGVAVQLEIRCRPDAIVVVA